MAKIGDHIRTDDFKTEKHVPVIEFSGAKAGEAFEVRVTIGKEIAHPNTTAHHIVWIELYYMPDGGNYLYHLGRADFLSHGATVKGPDSETIFCDPSASFRIKLDKPGRLIALSYCNIHGLWESSADLKL